MSTAAAFAAATLNFAEALREPDDVIIAPFRFIQMLGLKQQELADLARVHRTTVSEAPSNTKLQHFMRESLRVISAVRAINGDLRSAIFWYRNTPIPEFDHRTAESLVVEGKTEAVVRYLDSISSGSTG